MNTPFTFDAAFYLHSALTLLHFLWQGLLLAAIASLAGWCLHSRSAVARYRVYAATLLLMLACLPVNFVFLHGRAVVQKPDRAFNDGTITVPVASPEPPDTAVVLAAPASIAGPLARWTTILYLIGVGAMLARMVFGLAGTRRLRRDARPLTDPDFLDAVRRHAERLHLRHAPVVAYCSRVAVPALVGLWRPMILLPTVLATGLTLEQLELVILHEMAHVRRWDNAWLLVQRLVESVLFFHPAVWYVSRHMSIERELCCDEMVVGLAIRRSAYAGSLLRVAELTAGNRAAIPAGATMTSPREGSAVLTHRVMRILGGSKFLPMRLLRNWPKLTAATLFIAAVCFVGLKYFDHRRGTATASEIALARSMVAQELLTVHWSGLDTFDNEVWVRNAEDLRASFRQPNRRPQVFNPAKKDGPQMDSVEQMFMAELAPDEDEIYHRTSSGTLRYLQRIRVQKNCLGCHVTHGIVFNREPEPDPNDLLTVGDVLAIVSVEVRPDPRTIPRAVP